MLKEDKKNTFIFVLTVFLLSIITFIEVKQIIQTKYEYTELDGVVVDKQIVEVPTGRGSYTSGSLIVQLNTGETVIVEIRKAGNGEKDNSSFAAGYINNFHPGDSILVQEERASYQGQETLSYFYDPTE